MPSKRQPPGAQRDAHDLTGLRVFMYYRVSRDSSRDEKSVRDQKTEGHLWANRAGVRIAGEYQDVSLSASQFARKERTGYQNLLAVITEGGADLVWFWALNRATRQAREYLDLAELCQANGVRWVISGKVYDLGDDEDTVGLDLHNIMDKRYSTKLSKDVLRGKRSSADAGRPAGVTPYGYIRHYDPVTRQFRSQDADTWDDNGRPIEDSPAAVVREIYTRIDTGASVRAIHRDLVERGIVMPRSGKLSHTQVRDIAMSPTYLGRRIHQGEVLPEVQAVWPALVDEETWWRVQRILTDPERKKFRAGAGKSLLSFIARCDECGNVMVGTTSRTTTRDYGPIYRCDRGGHVAIHQSLLDDYVSKMVVAYMSDKTVAAAMERTADSAEAAHARADVEQAKVELEGWRKMAEKGAITPIMASRAEKGLMARIADADQRVQDATLPAVLHGELGPQAAKGWELHTLEEKRAIIRTIADIRVKRVGRGKAAGGGAHHPKDRVKWEWLIGASD